MEPDEDVIDSESEFADESLSSSEEDSEAIPNADLLRGVCLGADGCEPRRQHVVAGYLLAHR